MSLMVPAASGAGPLSDQVDEIAGSIDDLESRVRSTLFTGGSSPISFSGEARLKVQYHNLGFDAPGYMQADRSYMQFGGEGNENIFRLGMIVRPGRNTVLWSKIGFQHTLTGNYYYMPDEWNSDGSFHYQYRQDKSRNSITIHEDMAAGIAVRTSPASFWLKLGNTMWTEASPLTVWKSQPRTFAWEYLPFEIEQPIARYYEYNIARGEKTGRAAWNKRSFNGINLESINMPWNLYTNFIYGTFERFDNFEREFIDFGNDLGYADGDGASEAPSKLHGVGESYRRVIHGRVAKSKMFGDMTLGLNYVGINYKEDAIFAGKVEESAVRYAFLEEFRGSDSLFLKEPKTLSIDLRGPVLKDAKGDILTIHADLALNWTDTMWLVNPDGVPCTPGTPECHPGNYTEKSYSKAPSLTSPQGYFSPAAYAKVNYNGALDGKLPMELDLAYIHPGFYSPFSFAAPIDAFYAFGSNMMGAGKFVARGEGSPYTQNMTGANLTLNPALDGYGHLRVKYGHHMNIRDGRDLLFFPYRLNGADMYTFFQSSFNRWGNSLIDNSTKTNGRTYTNRLGDESFRLASSYFDNAGVTQVAGPGAGGLRSDFMSMFEGFVPYRDSLHAFNNWRLGSQGTIRNNTFNELYYTNETYYREPNAPFSQGWATIDAEVDDSTSTTNSSWVPVSKKHTFNLELDAAYDIGSFVGYKNDLFVGGYAGINGVTRGFDASSLLAFGDKGDNTLLWSFYLRFEPAIALSKNFYILGLFGFENWRSQQAWMTVHSAGAKKGEYINPTLIDGTGAVDAQGNFMPVTPGQGVHYYSFSPANVTRVPINYHDYAYGIGFDWDMLQRVGLHGRMKWMSHTDKGLNDYYAKLNKERRENRAWNAANPGEPQRGAVTEVPKSVYTNDWSTPVFSLELKTWF